MRFEIKNRWTGETIYSDEAESFSLLIQAAVKAGANLDGANLTRANLDGANLTRANLYGANLTRANLDGANLTRANLTCANLDGASLDGANLTRANLTCANLDGASLDGANLTRANLTCANLDGASLDGASLDGASLDGANLTCANLDGASLDKAIGIYSIVPEAGEFTAFKKLANGVTAKILIPEDAERVGGWTGRKCRASKAIVLEGEGVSKYDSNFTYKPGAILIPDSWDNDARVECSHGIHFFITRKEAEEY